MREWYRSGAKQSEKNLHHGALHGVSVEWFDTGKQKKRTVAELGVLIESDEWDDDGNLVGTYRLSENDANYKSLQLLRSVKWQK